MMAKFPLVQADKIIKDDFWQELKSFTDARIALGHTGVSLPTKELQKFSLAHAQARDSVHMAFDTEAIQEKMKNLDVETLLVNSQAVNRSVYLRRPDLGRLLSEDSKNVLQNIPQKDDDVTLVIADGLSAKAVHKQAVPLIRHLMPYLEQLQLSLSPVILAKQARVGLGDEIGSILHPKFVVMIIGERPGLTSPDSLSVYLTYNPRSGRLESERNCISNIRPEGLPYDKAAFKLAWLIEHALLTQRTGIELKDKSDDSSTYKLIRPCFNEIKIE